MPFKESKITRNLRDDKHQLTYRWHQAPSWQRKGDLQRVDAPNCKKAFSRKALGKLEAREAVAAAVGTNQQIRAVTCSKSVTRVEFSRVYVSLCNCKTRSWTSLSCSHWKAAAIQVLKERPLSGQVSQGKYVPRLAHRVIIRTPSRSRLLRKRASNCPSVKTCHSKRQLNTQSMIPWDGGRLKYSGWRISLWSIKSITLFPCSSTRCQQFSRKTLPCPTSMQPRSSSKFSSQRSSHRWLSTARKLRCPKTCLPLLKNSKCLMRASRLKQRLTTIKKKMSRLKLSLSSFKTRLLTSSRSSYIEAHLLANSSNNNNRMSSSCTNSKFFSITIPRSWPMHKPLSRCTISKTEFNSSDSTNHCKCFLTWDRQLMKNCRRPSQRLTMLWAKLRSLRLAAFRTSDVSMSIQVSMSRCLPCILTQQVSSTQYCSSKFHLKDCWALMGFNTRPVSKRAQLIVTNAQMSSVMANRRQLLTFHEKCLTTTKHRSKRFAAIKTK